MSDPFRKNHINHFTIGTSPASTTKLYAGFSTRHGGVSDAPFESLNLGLHVNDKDEKVIENRKRLADTLDTRIDQWVFADQVHGNGIQKVGTEDSGKGSKTYYSGIMGNDGLYTKDSGIVLALAYADCVPVFFSSDEDCIIGIAHAGWKGSVKKIASKMINTWVSKEGVPIESIHVTIGPSIHSCCYEVDQRVIHHVDEVLEVEDPRPYVSKGNSKFQLDLQQLNKQLLIKAGIPDKNIEVSSLCTSCNVDDFFSHRKEDGTTGRMLGFIMLDHS